MLSFGFISADEALSHAVSEQLRGIDGAWQCALFPSVEDALSAWGENLPQLLFWDCEGAPVTEEMAAFLAHRLRETHPSPLLLVLGAPPPVVEDFGVTELFTRPLRLGYFLTRLQFYQRVLNQAPDVVFALKEWRFAPRQRTLTRTGTNENIKLTEKESGLLEYLCAAETPVPREELLAAIWGYDVTIDTHTLETHIYRLRRKLMPPDMDGEDVFVTTGGGYAIHPTWRTQGR